MKERLMLRPCLAVAATLAGAALLAACGDDEDNDDGSAEPTALEITATGGEGGLQFEAGTTEVPAGATEITLTNDSEAPTDGQLVYTTEEHSEDEVIAELGNAIQGKGVAEWFEGGGGPAVTQPGETASATQELQPGTYWVVGSGDDPPQSPLASITVTDEDGAEVAETEATVEAVDYSFSGEGLTAGENAVRLTNEGEQWHHFIGAKMAEDATIEDVQAYFETEEGPPPLEETEEGQIESTVLEGGTSQVVDLDLDAGRYAFFCFIADKQGGPPHIEMGMLSEIEVAE